MDIMEKVEQLRAHANISFEEARTVLEEAGGDLLEAVILLERQGKIKKPETELMEMEAEKVEQNTEEAEPKSEKAAGKAAGKSSRCTGKEIGNAVRKIVKILKNNSFSVTRKDNLLFMMPAWVFALGLLFAWRFIIPAMLISLFFDVKFAFTGEDDLSDANKFMDKVGDMAEEVKNEFTPA